MAGKILVMSRELPNETPQEVAELLNALIIEIEVVKCYPRFGSSLAEFIDMVNYG
jgi:hypothetical protein